MKPAGWPKLFLDRVEQGRTPPDLLRRIMLYFILISAADDSPNCARTTIGPMAILSTAVEVPEVIDVTQRCPELRSKGKHGGPSAHESLGCQNCGFLCTRRIVGGECVNHLALLLEPKFLSNMGTTIRTSLV